MNTDPLQTPHNETTAAIQRRFELIVQEGNLQVYPNAEFPGIHRAQLGHEQAMKLFAELGVPGSEIEERASYEEIVVIIGEPSAEIKPHIHERTPTFIVGVDGEAEVLVGEEYKVLTGGVLIDFPLGANHGLKMSENGCVFIACSKNKVVDGGRAIDIKLTE